MLLRHFNHDIAVLTRHDTAGHPSDLNATPAYDHLVVSEGNTLHPLHGHQGLLFRHFDVLSLAGQDLPIESGGDGYYSHESYVKSAAVTADLDRWTVHVQSGDGQQISLA